MNQFALRFKSVILLAIIFLLSSVLFAQVNENEQQAGTPETTDQEKPEKEKKDKKKKDEFKVFAGVTFNQLLVSENVYESSSIPGFDLGFSYKRGRFFYWEIGARYNNYVYDLQPLEPFGDNVDTSKSNNFGVRVIDVPITGGINFTSFVSRIIGVRVFVSAIPSFSLSMGENSAGLTKDNTNGFNFHGQGGVGVDIAFFFLEAGYNYGFVDFIQDQKSNPSQVFVNIGFRF